MRAKILGSSVIVFLAVIIGFSSTYAQTMAGEQKNKLSDEEKMIEYLKQKPQQGFFGISFTNSVPQGEFQDNLQKSGQGLSLFGGFYADPLPLAVVLNVDLLFYGGDEKRGRRTFTDQWGVSHYIYDTASTQNIIVPINIFGRLQQNIGNFFFPYAEVNVGMNIFSTSYTYKAGGSYTSSVVPYEDTQSNISVAFNYGIGAGVMFKLFEFIELPSSIFSITLDIRMKYLKGSEATYYQGNFVNDKFELDEMKSKTDLIITQAGLTFRF